MYCFLLFIHVVEEGNGQQCTSQASRLVDVVKIKAVHIFFYHFHAAIATGEGPGISIEGGKRLLHAIDHNHMQHTEHVGGFGETDVAGMYYYACIPDKKF